VCFLEPLLGLCVFSESVVDFAYFHKEVATSRSFTLSKEVASECFTILIRVLWILMKLPVHVALEFSHLSDLEGLVKL
jgi:hypothetical protein